MFTTEVFQPDVSSWEKIRDRIIFLEREAFGDTAFSDQELAEDFENKKNVIILLKESEAIVGFIYAKPIEDAEPDRAEEKGETAYLWDIVIDKEYRGRHLAGVLMSHMEEELKKADYKYMDMCAAVANNFAENISKVYKGRIVRSEPLDSKWGPQIFFRVTL